MIYWLIYFIGFALQSKEEEREWMFRVQNGDTEALRKLYHTYKNLLFGLIITILKSREEAEDCLQDVFTQAWEKADKFDAEKGNVYSFLVTMARNKAIDRTRSRAFKDTLKEDHMISDFTLTPESEGKNPHENLELHERANKLKNALKKLSDKEQQVLYVAYYNGLSQSEISEKMDIPLGTVKYRMRQGMLKLKDMLISEDIN
ncbi:MAG: sigma-70 family RNA polymerase sigma factor [Balneolaceae bacterium]|nr:MAG: sigma-70 family RNA polymerase sigma factor [Balneolaceae bacterium]